MAAYHKAQKPRRDGPLGAPGRTPTSAGTAGSQERPYQVHGVEGIRLRHVVAEFQDPPHGVFSLPGVIAPRGLGFVERSADDLRQILVHERMKARRSAEEKPPLPAGVLKFFALAWRSGGGCGIWHLSGEDEAMAESVYKVVELIGTSTESWEKAAAAAVTRASQSLRDLRIAEVSELDMHIEDGKVQSYRAKIKVSFKYEGGD